MEISGLIWLEDIVGKLMEKHGVEQQEVRQVLTNRPKIRFVEKGHYPDEDVYAALGQTNAGRRLTVYFVYKQDRRALNVSARDMTRAERRQYGKK